MMLLLLWTLLSFLSGSMMFSYWLGRIARRDLKQQGDGNPGAMNLWKSAGHWYGLSGIVLDWAKGYVPILLLLHAGAFTSDSNRLLLPSAAAILGHMFSPFLRGKGGKGIAVTFGVWSALTMFTASLAFAIILALLMVIVRLIDRSRSGFHSSETDGVQVVLGMVLLGGYLAAADYSSAIQWFWLLSVLLLGYSHRREWRRFYSRIVHHRTPPL
ncbi:glycerol-3-phosphate acyltransferase 1 [Paenibacillus sp. CCS19]|uniref:glycerol-3-phosphate acyltransferase n=1 Tax=Paenibacillus sp. CCS19 TaxID=3158387 RepID=UPI002562EECE|nr:glycerol-3-phosphate acyltransferase [Paenibacillus cellulosilyticus]GMK42296.1 glycerol-3-phosphate acyltransferase 1 [Paenibacillus cellulosilyticus]